MLLELKVHNFAIIENISLEFKTGLNILSGETGAGKSVLLKSLTLLMGEKADTDAVRSGCESATVEGSFDISERYDIIEQLKSMGIDIEDDLLVVRRVISAQGKSRVYINSCLCTLTTLQNIVSPLIELTSHKAPLIELTSQHENKNLMSKNYHLDILDHYIGSTELRLKFQKEFKRFNEIESEILDLEEKSRTQAQRLDYLKYQKEEIEALDLKPGQDTDLESRYFELKNSAKIISFLEESQNALFSDDDSVLVRIHKILQRTNEFSSFGEGLKKLFEPLSASKALLEDLIYDIRTYEKNLSSDPETLNELESKMTQYRHLQKKHGSSVEEILNALSEINSELSTLENSDQIIAKLKQEKELLEQSLLKTAKDLHKRRQSGASLLAKSVNDELKDLNMKGVTLHVSVLETKTLNSNGISEVEFMIQGSSKETPRSISKYASGGELSRILLSVKKVVGYNDLPRTYLFDEVDTGVSGITAEKVGKKLKSIAKGQQVICVTHLAQVAAFGDTHFLIEKKVSKSGSQMQVLELSKDKRESEIARLISGEKITKTSIEHARSLLKEI